ncbi:hypothetical protein CVT26_011023 [Gymnopilus dilepis]|uniref:Uncharacterized protein n=1 Tax=Gymnopilus dilepis TaxID=231916 RepID=A0A409VY10_9AGAR|nr:hypothetical protein CVT26_011023 [Gymnopilus dilepis]
MATPPPNRYRHHHRDTSRDLRSPTASQPTTPTSSSSSTSTGTAADIEACASFLEEVDEWLVRINQRVAELEHRHKKHLLGEGWDWMAKYQYRGDMPLPAVDDGDDRVSGVSVRYPTSSGARKK